MASSGIKPEIKIDPAEDSKNLADIEAFEDDNDLKFPADGAQAWLLKLPAYLWKEWDSLYKDAPENERIQVGTLRVWDQDDPKWQQPKLMLDTKLPEQKKLPPTYSLDMGTTGYHNALVFSEKDIPGYRPTRRNYNKNRFDLKSSTGAIPTKQERYGEKLGYRSAIPKQTALAPKIVNEGRVIPTEDEHYTKFMTGLWEEIQPTKDIEIEGMERNRQIGLHNMSAFSTSSKIKGGHRKKVAKEKNVRMDKEALSAAVMRCYRHFQYWRLSSLRQELKQPEAWIKELMEEIGILVKSGDFMNTWQLKPAWQAVALRDANSEGVKPKEEVADRESGSDSKSDDESGDDDDDEDESKYDKMDIEIEKK